MILELDASFDSSHRDLSNEAISTSIRTNFKNLSSSTFLHIYPRSQESCLTAIQGGGFPSDFRIAENFKCPYLGSTNIKCNEDSIVRRHMYSAFS